MMAEGYEEGFQELRKYRKMLCGESKHSQSKELFPERSQHNTRVWRWEEAEGGGKAKPLKGLIGHVNDLPH